MKVLLHSWSLGRELLAKTITPDQLPAIAQQAGFSGVEWLDRLMPPYCQAEWERLARAQDDAGFEDAALSICLELSASQRSVQEQVENALLMLKMCSALKVKVVRVSVGGSGAVSMARALLFTEEMSGKKRRRERPLGRFSRLTYRLALAFLPLKKQELGPMPDRETLRVVAAELRPLASRSAELGMTFGIENHYGMTSHPEALLDLVEMTGQGTGVCLDLGNFPNGLDALEACRHLACKTVHVHFKTRKPHPIPEAVRQGYPDRLLCLSRVGYKGAFSVEYEGSPPGLAGAVAGARLVRRWWPEILGDGPGRGL